MPVFQETIPDVSQSVMRPIVFDVVSQVQDITKIDKSARIFFPGDTNKMQQGGTSIDDKNRDALIANNQTLFIEVEEDYDLEALSTTAVNYKEFEEVFNDGRVSTSIAPIYVDSTVVIHFKYRTKSKSEAQRWRDDMRVHISAMRDINLHDLTYHYLLPSATLQVLKKIYELRENVAGYGETFEQWIHGNAVNRLTVIGDLVNKNACLGISETQTRVVGIFDFNAVPDKPTRDDATGTWEIAFSYRFIYNRPAAVCVRYPVMVHNQLLPPEYVTFNNQVPNDPTKKTLSFTKSLKALNFFEQQSLMSRYVNADYALRIPTHDEFTITNPPPFTGTIFTALCESDLETKKDLFSLYELGDLELDPDILDFIAKSEAPYITKLYQSIFNLSLYRGNFLAGDQALLCDNKLNVSTTHVQNLRIVHRVRLSIITDLSVLNQNVLNRIKKYPVALFKIIQCINESLANNPRLAGMSGKRYVGEDDFSELLRFYNAAKLRPGQFVARRTLQLGSIVSYRKEAA